MFLGLGFHSLSNTWANQSSCSITITLEVAFKFEIRDSGETNVRQVGILRYLYHCSGRPVTLRKFCTGNVTSVG